MRYIGNKTKLLPFIRDALDRLGVDGRRACDPFAGTAAVARFLKSRGWDVVCGDLLSFSYSLQCAYVVVDREPTFETLADVVGAGRGDGSGHGETEPTGPGLAAVIEHLNDLEPRPDFIHAQFSPDGDGADHDRRYFTPRNAARIDAIRGTIEAWQRDDRLTEAEYHVLLTALIEAADRVANTTGIYAAYVKSWQPNARRRLRLRPPDLVTGTGRECSAHRADALEIVERAAPFALLYLDPPYNTRQYAGYYHIPEILADGWFDERPDLRGKTGLPPDGDKRSDWSRRAECERAFTELIAAARTRHILMSYNSEGIIPESTIEAAFRERGDPSSFTRLERAYKRYRSDSDGPDRRYRGDRVTEKLYYVRVDPAS